MDIGGDSLLDLNEDEVVDKEEGIDYAILIMRRRKLLGSYHPHSRHERMLIHIICFLLIIAQNFLTV